MTASVTPRDLVLLEGYNGSATGGRGMNGIQLAEHIGVSYRRIDFWTRQGYLRPTNPDCGSGRRRDYGPIEQRVAKAMGVLVEIGLTPEAAHAAARGDGSALWALVEALRPIVEAA